MWRHSVILSTLIVLIPILINYPHYYWYIISALLISSIGFIDDIYQINWKIKICLQLVIGIGIIIHFLPIIPNLIFFGHPLQLNSIWTSLIFLLWFIGILNAMNLIDGMDGLAGGTMLLSSLGFIYFGWFHNDSLLLTLYCILSGSLFGFLYFNGKPAKYFMGDSGSLFLSLPLLALHYFLFSKRSSTQSLDQHIF